MSEYTDKYVRRIVVSTHLGTGLYADECCGVGPCTREPGHAGLHRDAFEGDHYHPISGKAGEIDWPASFAAYAAENEAAISAIFDQWFQSGVFAAEETHGIGNASSPHPQGSAADNWWRRGFAHASRLLRALKAERDVRVYADRYGALEAPP